MNEYWVLFLKSELLFVNDEEGNCHLDFQPLPPVKESDIKVLFKYHTGDGIAVNVIQTDVMPSDGRYQHSTLRESYYHLSEKEFLLAGKSWELLYWHLHTRYCGACGTPTVIDTEISKKCPSCGEEYWPLLNVAVICLIYRGDEVLMVRAKTFRSNFYGLVAGFVETGETLEDALRREVYEETSLRIKNIRYFDSQP